MKTITMLVAGLDRLRKRFWLAVQIEQCRMAHEEGDHEKIPGGGLVGCPECFRLKK